MFIRVVYWILAVALYTLTFFLGFMTVGLFILIVLQAPWMALIIGVLAGLFAVWFVRGLEHDVDEVGYRRCGSEGVRQPTERRYNTVPRLSCGHESPRPPAPPFRSEARRLSERRGVRSKASRDPARALVINRSARMAAEPSGAANSL
jgi:hypothetical protein